MNTFLAIGSFIIRLIFGIVCILAASYLIYISAQILSWKEKDKQDIFNAIFSILASILFYVVGLLLIVPLFI